MRKGSMMVLTGIGTPAAFDGLSNVREKRSGDLHRLTPLDWRFYRRRPFQFVPGKFLAFGGPLQGLQQDDRKQLAIGEALQPYLAEQPCVFFTLGPPPLERKCNRRCEEIDHQERQEKDHEFLETGWIRRFRGERVLTEEPGHTEEKHDVDERRHQR